MSGLTIPSHVAAARLAVPTIRYVWRDWEEGRLYDTSAADELMLERLDDISYRGTLALTIACAEWVVYRYEGLSDIRMHLQYIEAAWASVVDDRYLRPWEPTEEEFTGPILGPLACALLMVQEAMESTAQELDGGLPVAYISNLAARVLPKPSPFRAWRDETIERLLTQAPRDPADSLGDVVPREFFDEALSLAPQQVELLTRRFMEGLDPARNPNLHDIGELAELHYDLPPYTYDLALDREDRDTR